MNLSAGTLDFKSIRLTCFLAGVINVSSSCGFGHLSSATCTNMFHLFGNFVLVCGQISERSKNETACHSLC